MDFNSINKTIAKIIDKEELLDTDWMNLAYISDLVKREEKSVEEKKGSKTNEGEEQSFQYLEEIPTRFLHEVIAACNCSMLHANNLIEFVFSQDKIIRGMDLDYELYIAGEILKKRDKA
ncbi:MAG: hypothetical protein IIZ93_15030 [Acidaminococcaceae bacterium]|nr:hypothetical protein [Acidaminococcaceae bacterium]